MQTYSEKLSGFLRKAAVAHYTRESDECVQGIQFMEPEPVRDKADLAAAVSTAAMHLQSFARSLQREIAFEKWVTKVSRINPSAIEIGIGGLRDLFSEGVTPEDAAALAGRLMVGEAQ